MRIVITPRKPAVSSPVVRGPVVSAAVAAGRHTAIAPANLQAVLDSAANAAAKGQAAYFTPVAWAEALALALPSYRPVIVDLTCGNGQLLAGASAPGTFHRLGCDIEDLPASDLRPPTTSPASRSPVVSSPVVQFIQADVTLLAPYLHKANWIADCFVLNFPFDHHMYRDRLPFLGESNCRAVEMAFNQHDGRTSKDTIDSTIAGLCLALDRCSPYGEGFIIANNSTVERLIFGDGSRPQTPPHAALAAHIWCRVTIQGNICNPSPTGVGEGARRADEGRGETPFRTSILYFARSHTSGVNKELAVSSLAEAAYELAKVGKARLGLRAGSVIRQYEGGHTNSTAGLWDAIGLEWRTDQGKNRPTDQRWNIWLDADGTLATNLTPFQEAAEPLKKEQYVRLHALKGKHPMQLILQKAERKELERAVFGAPLSQDRERVADEEGRVRVEGEEPSNEGRRVSPWRVAPAVIEAVQGALAEYNAVRSPLYPLSQIQRLGYLDEEDDILCLKDLWLGSTGNLPVPSGNLPAGSKNDTLSALVSSPVVSSPVVLFHAGQRYTLRTETISVKRSGRKMNLTGELDDVEWEGSELALFIKDGEGLERLFMEERLRGDDVRLSIQAEDAPSPIEFSLQQLAEHFEIPEVPDVAAVNPEGYQRNLALLKLIEEIVNSQE